MWRCPNCGEEIDDVFDACWNCGTAQDGTLPADFHAEPGDPEVPDPGPGPGPDDRTAGHAGAASADPKNVRIVELCSAADPIAAYALRDVLAEAGIRARVVGELLGNAPGGLPLGVTFAPRIWVREQDLARALEIVDKKTRPGRPAGDDEQLEPDETSDDEPAPGRFRGLGRGFAVIGLACVVLGVVWAAYDWTMIRRYSAVADGVLVSYREHFAYHESPPPEIPFQREPGDLSFWYEVHYAFEVHGKTYYAVDPRCQDVVTRMPIHYDPASPSHNVAGPLTSPWSVLKIALGVGGFLLLFGFCLASRGRAREPAEA